MQVPQRPYNAIGSLAQQITYPVEPDLTDAATVATLNDLMHMVSGANAGNIDRGPVVLG